MIAKSQFVLFPLSKDSSAKICFKDDWFAVEFLIVTHFTDALFGSSMLIFQLPFPVRESVSVVLEPDK